MFNALIAYMIASTLAFFQHNLQFIYPYFKDKTALIILTSSIPISYLYYTSWTYFVKANGGSVWSARFVFFGLSYFIYPTLAFIFMNETPFTLKTLLCTFLSIMILVIQYKL